MKINLERGDICPICEMVIKNENYWQPYHISYVPELVILACKYCNFLEWAIREDKEVLNELNESMQTRKHAVLNFITKFDRLRTTLDINT